jgi:hypothetical protein
MSRLLSGSALVAAVTLAATAFAATPVRPLGGPYVPETAPAPPTTISPYYGDYGGGDYGGRYYRDFGLRYYPYYGGYFR